MPYLMLLLVTRGQQPTPIRTQADAKESHFVEELRLQLEEQKQKKLVVRNLVLSSHGR
jgi:hypothetical protein